MQRTAPLTLAGLLALTVAALPRVAAAEVELSFYLGTQSSPHSRVEGTDNSGAANQDFNFLAEWEGRSGQNPPYYGIRLTWWRTENVGYGVELNHAKVYLEDGQRQAEGFQNFELTDGINIITANAFYRWPGQWANGAVTPYVGGGLGIAVPHVDVERNGLKTFEYQFTGPAATWIAGISYDLNETWGLFAEYKGTYSMNEADLAGGGSFTSDIITNALNVGVTYRF